MQMTKRISSLVLAIVMLLEILVPQTTMAKKEVKAPSDNLVKVGLINGNSYDSKLMLELNRLTAKSRKKRSADPGTRPFGYFEEGQEPKDADKLKYHGEVKAALTVKGLDGNDFQWKEIFGSEEVHLKFTQINDDTDVETGTERVLNISQAGEYTWTDGEGNPAELPLFNNKLEPLTYEVKLDEEVSDRVKLLTARLATTGDAGSPTFEKPDAEGRIKYHLTLEIGLQQVASSKFVSEWHTAVGDDERPQLEGTMTGSNDSITKVATFKLPKNDTDSVVIRTNSPREGRKPDKIFANFLYKKPKTVEVKTDTQGLTFKEEDGVKTVKSGDHKFKYDFTYDVINGGKLTMTEVIPVTFDANGGKFASIKDENAEQKIVKEVDYDGTLTDKAENPTKPGKAFKGWATDKEGNNPATDKDYKNLKATKTFYAIWSDEDIQAEELKTTESLGSFPKKGPRFTNDFVPTFEDLKGQVKAKDANGKFVELPDDVKFSIVDGTKEYTENSDDLKKFIYDKVKENNKDEVSRTETVEAKVKYSDGTERKVEIPITVLKNIYKGSDQGNKLPYIPDDYVKVTIDPTEKAQSPDKTYYYVNPNAKVEVPKEKTPVGTGDNKFSKWTIKADGETVEKDYEFGKRQVYDKDHTITAQYGTGKIKIAYVDQDGNKIDAKYQISGQDYSSEKSGGLGRDAIDMDFPIKGPDFKGYIFDTRESIKGKHYKDQTDPNNLDTVTYKYYKKVTTKEPTNKNAYFPVIFDANGGKFESDSKDKKTVYVHFDGSNSTKEKVTFKEVKDEFEKAYSNPTKGGFDFKEWQNAKTNGTKPADDYEIQFKGWNWDADPDNGYVPETFYAHYEQASAFVKYLDLDGKPIADDYKINGVEYPTEKTGKAGDAIASDVFTIDTAPKFTGYKFNRIELNPANSKYALDKKATIKIYYEKVPDVIPANPDGSNPDSVPADYVRVEFVPTEKGTIDGNKVFFVNPKKEVTIPVNNPKANATYTFKEWKMGVNADGEKYTPSNPKKFTQDTTITATYDETENIIPYDPSVLDPMVRPDGYVRVTFAAETGLKLTESKAYYVKKNAKVKLSEIKSDETKYGYPKYKEETGYKFEKWDKEDTLEIAATDIVVTAKPTKLDNVIPEKDKNNKPNEKPEGYKEVTFVIKTDDAAKGSITGVAKFYVNPTEYVTINPPETKANTGFKFGAWDKDATIPKVYKEDETITGSFNGLKDVIPKTKTDESEKPKGYVTVTFELEKLDGKEAGKIVDGETITYFVKPNTDVTIPRPKILANTGYEFINWNPDTSKNAQYSEDKTVKGSFKKLDDIISYINDKGKPTAKPDGYVTVVFDKGAHGSLTGVKTYYVNPVAKKTMGELKKKAPKVTPETGYEFTSWSRKDEEVITEDSDEYIIMAIYAPLPDVIPKTKTDESEKPKGYVEVKFVAGKNGKLIDSEKEIAEKVYYVNPEKYVKLTAPTELAKGNTGYVFSTWDRDISNYNKFTNKVTKITANFVAKDAVVPKTEDDDSEKPEGFVTVKFEVDPQSTGHGSLEGTTTYFVDPSQDVTLSPPKTNPSIGYEFEKWSQDTTQAKKYEKDTTVTGTFKKLDDIIPGDQAQPKGYLTVTFVADSNGSLSGTTKYYVKPNTSVDLSKQADAITKTANLGYTEKGGTWTNKEGKKLKDRFSKDAEFVFNFVKLDDVIPAGGNVDQPKGYVKVEFIAGENGSLKDGNKTYYVNPEKNITVGSTELPIPDTKPSENYKFDNWYEAIDKTEPIKNDKKFVARFKLNKVTMTYKADDKTSGDVPEALSYEIGTEITLAGKNNLKKNNYLLTGWEIGGITYTPGAKYKIEGNTTATAVWEAGLHTVNFDTGGGTHIDSQQVKHGEKITEVNNPQKDGYFFTGWTLNGNPFNPKTDVVTKDITLVANYSKDIIPQTGDTKPEGVPDSFVLVEFKPGTNGTLTGTTKYWVNPTAGKKLSDIAHPSVTAKDDWKHTGWDKADTTSITGAIEVTAQYLEKVLTTNPNDTENYVKVDFQQGEHGTIDANATSTYWVLKDEAVKLTPPAVTSKDDYAQKTGDGAWSPQIAKSYSEDTEHVAQYDYNGENVIPQKGVDKPDTVPDNFVLVEFKPGSQGTIAPTETVKYWVNPTALVTLPAPKVTPNAGYEQQKGFNAWDHYLRDIFREETVITAQYKKDLGGDWQTGTLGSTRILTVVEKEVVKVPAEKTFRKEVRYMQGFNNYFRPTEGLTRAEAAQILANALVEDGYRYDPNFTIHYKDIVGNEWYAKAIRITSQANVFKGYDTGYFDPHKKITRAEWIGTLRRFQELERAPGNHMQVRPDHWAMGEIEAAYKEGWLAIYGQGLARFNADEFIPRQEVAAVSNKAFNRVLDKTYIHRNSKNLINYKDVNPSMWSYEDILCASNGYLHDGKSFWGHKIDYKKDLYNINLDGYTVTKDKFQRLERR